LKKILILKTGSTVKPLRDRGEDFEDWIIAGCELPASWFETIEVFTGESMPVPDRDRWLAVIVTGSPAFVTDREPWSEAAARFLRSAVQLDIPILGICYGHQLLAHCLGGRVGDHPRGREIGTVVIDLNAAGRKDRLLGDLPACFKGQVSHSQSVLEMPPAAILLAGSEFEPHQAFRIGERAWGVQFHPEFSASVVRAYIQDRHQQLLQEHLDPRRLSETVEPTPEAASLLARFVQLATADSTAAKVSC